MGTFCTAKLSSSQPLRPENISRAIHPERCGDMLPCLAGIQSLLCLIKQYLHTVSLGSIRIALAGPAVSASRPASTIKHGIFSVFNAFVRRRRRRPPQSVADQKYDIRTKEKPEVTRPRGKPSSCKRQFSILCSKTSPTLATISSS